MKRFLAFVVCTVLLLCALPIVAFAENDSVDSVEPSAEAVDTLPTTEETATEGENSDEKAMPEITPELIVEYIKVHFEEISVIITMIGAVFYEVRKHKLLNKSIGTLNNNAVKVAEDSDHAIQNALTEVNNVSAMVAGYKTEFTSLLAEFRASEEEKKSLEKTLSECQAYLKASKLANVELANEVAELLVLANIPNAKKDELYKKHVEGVQKLEAEEVKSDDGTEA